MIQRRAGVARELQQGAEIIVRLRVVGIDTQRLTEGRDRLVAPAARGEREPEVVVRRR